MSYIGNKPGDSYLTLEKQTFTTSATDTYTLDRAVSGVNDIELFLNNVRQEPTEAYSCSGTTLTLASAITSSDSMYCIYQGRSVGTQAPATGSVTNDMLAGSIATSKLADGSTFATTNGITVAQQYYLSADQNNTSDFFFTSNLTGDSASVGTSLTESSGVFSFPSTGIYQVTAYMNARNTDSAQDANLKIYFTTDNSTYNTIAQGGHRFSVASKNYGFYCQGFVDITDTSLCKVKFGVTGFGGTMTTRGGTDGHTKFTFIRLGDT